MYASHLHIVQMSPACHPHVVCRASTQSKNLPESPNFSSVIYLMTHMSSACHPCGPWVIYTLFLWSQAICTSSPWSLETGDDIRDHIWHQHSMSMSCPWSEMWSPFTEVIHTLFKSCMSCIYLYLTTAIGWLYGLQYLIFSYCAHLENLTVWWLL